MITTIKNINYSEAIKCMPQNLNVSKENEQHWNELKSAQVEILGTIKSNLFTCGSVIYDCIILKTLKISKYTRLSLCEHLLNID